jgi:hypothetical protein
MTVSDPERRATYSAEYRMRRWADTTGPVRALGNTWDLEPNAHFPGVAEIQAYVNRTP